MRQVETMREQSTGMANWRSTAGLMGITVLVVIVLDQITKTQATRWLGPAAGSHRYDVIGEWAGFEYVRNTGVAFGMLQGRQWLVSAMAIVVLIVFLAAFWRELPRHRLLQIAVAAVAGGAIGNLIDRFRLGYVVDFIAVGTFPRFNIADSSVTIGLVLLVWFLLAGAEPVESERPSANRNDEHDNS